MLKKLRKQMGQRGEALEGIGDAPAAPHNAMQRSSEPSASQSDSLPKTLKLHSQPNGLLARRQSHKDAAQRKEPSENECGKSVRSHTAAPNGNPRHDHSAKQHSTDEMV